MALYLIEAPHSAEEHDQAVAEVLGMAPGSQHAFVWGCRMDEHVGWAILEADGRGDALDTLPYFLRPRARVHRVDRFTARDLRPLWELPGAA